VQVPSHINKRQVTGEVTKNETSQAVRVIQFRVAGDTGLSYAMTAKKNRPVVARLAATTKNHHLELRIAAIAGNRIEVLSTPNQIKSPYGLSTVSVCFGKKVLTQKIINRTVPIAPVGECVGGECVDMGNASWGMRRHGGMRRGECVDMIPIPLDFGSW
jgi:hypothetical protein